jgi:hypothetical protein
MRVRVYGAGATTGRVLDDPFVRGFASAALRETAEIGARIGAATPSIVAKLELPCGRVHTLYPRG